jgi:hypothetical protein
MRLSINPSCRGKDRYTVGNDQWQQADFTKTSYLNWQYIAGFAIAPGLFDVAELAPDEKTQKIDARWQGSELIIVDVDDYEGDTLTDALKSDFVRTHCFAAYPSSSYTPTLRKYHFAFLLSVLVTDAKAYSRLAQHIAAQFPMPTDKALTRPSQAVYGTVFTKHAHSKALDDGLCYLNEQTQNIDTMAVLRALARQDNLSGVGAAVLTQDVVSGRAEKHYEQSEIVRERVTLEALEYALLNWEDKDYQGRLSLCLAARDGANTQAVMQVLLDRDAGYAWLSRKFTDFSDWWAQEQSGDTTVATLFFQARQNGWLQTTSVDLQQNDYEPIAAQGIDAWLAERPTPQRALIVSPTGTAKTLGAIAELKRLGTPKAVFFAPSIKLCTDLSAKLTAHGVTNTLYIDAGNTKDADTLAAANVLVTTLQTFAIKLVSHGIDLSQYRYAVVDESDELIGAFVRAEAGRTLGYGSHVNRLQSQWGMYTLKRIMQEVEHVLFFDATATRLSLQTMRRFCPIGKQPQCFLNEVTRPKAGVVMLPSVYDARRVALEAALRGHTLVVASDTRKEAELLAMYMLATGAVEADELITITGATHYDKRVATFLEDVEAGAKKYRIIIYNSAMGSGVSITETMPDVFVQIATYVSPRKNLQILNRFRRQHLVFAYVPGYENLYHETLQDKLQRLDASLANEVSILGAKHTDRDALARDIKALAALSVRDEYEQRRAPRDLYTALLARDGRTVSYHDTALADDQFKARFKQAYRLLAERAERVVSQWRSVPPISRENPPGDDATAEDIAKGLLHGRIDRMIDLDKADLPDDKIALLVLTYGRYIYNVERWLKLGKAVGASLDELTDDRRADVTLRLYVGRLELVSLLGLLIPDAHAQVDMATLRQNAPLFVREVQLRAPVFNSLAGRKRNFVDDIAARKNDDVELAVAYAKVILKSLGLSLRRKNGKRQGAERQRLLYCAGAQDVLTLLRWRGVQADSIQFVRSDYDAAILDARESVAIFNELGRQEQRDVTSRLRDMDTTLEAALAGSEF